jgi:hypothetical protein
VNGLDDFVALVRDETGVPATRDNVSHPLDAVPGWDSVHLIALLTALERVTGRRLSVPDVLTASSLEQIYQMAARS